MNMKPIAHISVQKNRVKKGHEVYLNDGTEFEIELYNPTDKVVCAEIHINNIKLEGGKLILNPAQRIHLDRYLNEQKKFKFSTYEVSGSQEEIREVVKNNGLIEVKFYYETQNQYTPNHWTLTSYPSPSFYPGVTNPTVTYPQMDQINPYTPTNYPPNTILYNDTNPNIFFNTNTTLNTTNNEYISINDNTKDIKESGRIEEGSKSNQEFSTVNKAFNIFSCAEYEYVILPISHKIIENGNVGTTYCTSCKLRKRKPNWKFCPKCGTEFEL